MNKILIKNILTEELFGYSPCQSTQDLNIVNYLYSNLLLEKLLYGEPLDISELRKLLRKKIVNFEFIKLSGEVRPARGTTLMRYIPPKDHPRGIRPSSPKVATFYDLDKDAWRSVSRRSKEIVLKKDEESDKPIIVVRDKSKVKVQPVVKDRESKDPIEQGQTYKYKTNRGTNTYIEIIRELPNGLYQVSSPVFKTTFAINPSRIGNKFTPKEEKPETKVMKPKEEPLEQQPKEEQPLKTPVVKPIVKAIEKPKQQVKPIQKVEPIIKQQKPKEPKTTILLPKEIEHAPEEGEEETKAPPIDITPPTERPEDLSNK